MDFSRDLTDIFFIIQCLYRIYHNNFQHSNNGYCQIYPQTLFRAISNQINKMLNQFLYVVIADIQSFKNSDLYLIVNAIYNKIKLGNRIQIMKPLICLFLTVFVSSKTFSFQNCNQSQIFSVTDLKCYECPQNKIPNPNQDIPTSCVCQEGFYADMDNGCVAYGTGVCGQHEYIPVFSRNGQSNVLGLSCQQCDDFAEKNENGTGCTACPMNMKYEIGQGCICSDSSMISSSRGCFPSSYTSALGNLGQSSSTYYQQLKYLIPFCYHFKDLLSCSHLVNLCTYSSASLDTAQCKFFQSANQVYSYLYFSSNNPYYMPAGTFNQQTVINFKLISFLPTGNYVGQKTMRLPDLVRCGMPSHNSGNIKIGNNLDFSCNYNFNYLLDMASSHTYEQYVYQLFIQGANQDYYQVAIFLDEASKATRRFFLQQTSQNNQIKIAVDMKLEILMNTTGHLLQPELYIQYKTLSVQGSKVTPDQDKEQSLKYAMTFKYDTSNFQTAFIAILIVVTVLALIQGIGRTYIEYLNRGSLSSFFFYFFKFWSLWIFYFLFCISGYWFLFSKTTQNLFIFIPSSSDVFYPIFYTLAGLMGFFRIITILIDKKDKLNTEVFMINWEKGQFKNSWREIFIVNSLAQFYTHRTISMFWLLLVVMFFLVGLDWEDHAAEVTHTNLADIHYFHPINRVFLYFLASSIFLIVGIIAKILRRLTVIKWPYPFEDFVDYCNVTNISFFFMKKRSPQAHYIHASIPDRTEVTYKQINDAIRRGLNKTRSISNQITFQDMQRMYTIYLCKDLEDKFNNMLKKIEDEEHQMNKNTQKKHKNSKKHQVNHRQQFIEKKLKPHLELIAREGSNRNKSISQSLLGMPPIDLRNPTSLDNRNFVIFDDNQQIVNNVFPNGNQFEEIHTVIIIFLMFILMTSNIAVSAFLAYFVDQYMINGWIANSCRDRLEKMTKVKEGFML